MTFGLRTDKAVIPMTQYYISRKFGDYVVILEKVVPHKHGFAHTFRKFVIVHNLREEYIFFRLARFKARFASRTLGKLEHFVKPHVNVFPVKNRTYFRYVRVEEFVEIGVRRAADRTAFKPFGRPASAFNSFVFKFGKARGFFVLQ